MFTLELHIFVIIIIIINLYLTYMQTVSERDKQICPDKLEFYFLI